MRGGVGIVQRRQTNVVVKRSSRGRDGLAVEVKGGVEKVKDGER